jgi:hypothetical protein
MRLLAVHQNFPDQFRRLAQAWSQEPGWPAVWALNDGSSEHPTSNEPKNRSYPARSSTGGGVGKVILPTMRWQM